MALTPLVDFSVFNEASLVPNFNSALVAMDANLQFVLAQATAQLPTASLGDVNKVVAVKDVLGVATLGYVPVESILDLQKAYDAFLVGQSTLTLKQSFDISLINYDNALRAFSITGRPSNPFSSPANFVEFSQIALNGAINETHVVGEFSVTANNVSFSTTVGPVTLNSLQVGDVEFPSVLGAAGTVLASQGGQLQFVTLSQPLAEDASAVTLTPSKPLVLPGLSTSTNYLASLRLGGVNAGLGFITASGDMFLRTATGPVFETTAMTGKTTRGLRLNTALVLPKQDTQSGTPDEASLWYDATATALMLQTAGGPVKIVGQIATGAPVTTETAADFDLHPDAKLRLGGGTEGAPSLTIGNSAFSSSEDAIKISVRSNPIVSISKDGVLSSVSTNAAAAALDLNAINGINNPTKPTYSFMGASGLGLFRSATDAMAVAVRGLAVVQFSDKLIDAKGNRITGLGTPKVASDAVSKSYLDSLLPVGTVAGRLSVYDELLGRYTESDASYSNGVLSLGNSLAAGTMRLMATGGGSVSMRSPAMSAVVDYVLPGSITANGLLTVDAGGVMSWVSRAGVLDGTLQSDGSVALDASLTVSVDSTEDAPIFVRGDMGLFLSAAENLNKFGVSYKGAKVFEIDGSAATLGGVGTAGGNALIRLRNLATETITTPTYSFASDPATGLTQTAVGGVGLVVGGQVVLSATSSALDCRTRRITKVAKGIETDDAATIGYVNEKISARKGISFRITALPLGYTANSSVEIILSLVDASLVYSSAAATLQYESESALADLKVPDNFNVSPNCQVFIDGLLLRKMPDALSVREARRLNASSLILAFPIEVGSIITVLL